jgi:hypothetical protein
MRLSSRWAATFNVTASTAHLLIIPPDPRSGLGLLNHALQRCVTAADLIGGRALIVNAVDVEAAAFWRRRGFIPSKDDPLIRFRSIADIAASLR